MLIRDPVLQERNRRVVAERGMVATTAGLCQLLGIEGCRAAAIAAHSRPAPPLMPELEAYRSPLRDRAEALYTNSMTAKF